MKPIRTRIVLACLIAFTALGAASLAFAQGANQEPPKQQTPEVKPDKPSRPLPIRRAKIEAVDKEKMTVTLGTRTYQVTSDTRIYRDGKPTSFDDVRVGDSATGSYRKLDDGTLQLVSLRIGEPQPPQGRDKDNKNQPGDNSPDQQ